MGQRATFPLVKCKVLYSKYFRLGKSCGPLFLSLVLLFLKKKNVKVILSFGLCKNSLWGNRNIFSIFLLLTTTNIPRHYYNTHTVSLSFSLSFSLRGGEKVIICGHWYSG